MPLDAVNALQWHPDAGGNADPPLPPIRPPEGSGGSDDNRGVSPWNIYSAFGLAAILVTGGAGIWLGKVIENHNLTIFSLVYTSSIALFMLKISWAPMFFYERYRPKLANKTLSISAVQKKLAKFCFVSSVCFGVAAGGLGVAIDRFCGSHAVSPHKDQAAELRPSRPYASLRPIADRKLTEI